MTIDNLIPVPGRRDYLIANGSRALISETSQIGWPFELALLVGRDQTGLTLHAAMNGLSLALVVRGNETALQPADLSLFVRACIRRLESASCALSWPAHLQLDVDDPMAARTRIEGSTMILEASDADLRPATQVEVSEVYRYPLDIPWLYNPLDYEVMIPILKAPGIRRILDLGCGSGRNAVALENAGYEVHGVDSAAGSLAMCRHFVRNPDRFLHADVTALPFADGTFDAVLDVGCLHMIPDGALRQMALAEAARVLRPDGILCGRALTPRAPGWLAAQPFRSAATGFSVEALTAEGRPHFSTHIWAKTDHLIYYRLSKVV